MYRLIIVLVLATFSTLAFADITEQDRLECLQHAQIAGQIVLLKENKGLTEEEIWPFYEKLLPTNLSNEEISNAKEEIDSFTQMIYNPQNSKANAADFMEYVARECLKQRDTG